MNKSIKASKESKESKVSRALSLLVEASAEAQLSDVAIRAREASLPGFMHEFCTIRCQTARGQGHSTAVANIVCSKFINKACLFAYNGMVLKRTMDIGMAHNPDFKKKILSCNVFGSPQWTNEVFDNLSKIKSPAKPNAFIVDAACLVSAQSIDAMYNSARLFLQPQTPFFVILVE